VVEPYEQYRAAMEGPWPGWWIAWPPTQRMSLGDVFERSGGVLRRAGSLAGRNVTFATAPGGPPASFLYDAQGSITAHFKLSGASPQGFSALAKADAGARLHFDHAESVLAVYGALTQEGFSDYPAVAAELSRLYWDGRWTTDHLAVGDVIMAATGLVATATKSGASAELRVSATAAAGPVSLLELAGAAEFAVTDQVGMQWTGTQVTPFYRVLGLRKTWLNRLVEEYGRPQPGQGAAPVPVPPLALSEARADPDAVLERLPQDVVPADDAAAPGT
jgi:hypothetical protein